MKTRTKYSLVSITLISLTAASDEDILAINGKEAGIDEDIHCVGSMIYEYYQEGWTNIFETCGITGDMIDTWYARSPKDEWGESRIDMVFACHYIHYPSNPYSPEEFDVTYEFIGVVDASDLIGFGLEEMKKIDA